VRAAEYFSSGKVQSAICGVGLGDREVVPVVWTVPDLTETRGVLDGRVHIRAAGLQQQHALTSVDETPSND
jgi:hypothetical protein